MPELSRNDALLILRERIILLARWAMEHPEWRPDGDLDVLRNDIARIDAATKLEAAS